VPHLVAVQLASSGRSVIAHVLGELRSLGYEQAGRLDGSVGWEELFAAATTRGLFGGRLFYVVDDADELGPFPEKFEEWLEGKEASNVIVLVYGGKCSAFPKKLMGKMDIVQGKDVPRGQRDRIRAIEELAANKGLKMTREAALLLEEWVGDFEELEGEIEKFSLSGNAIVTADLVRELSKDEGARAMYRLLDGVCTKDAITVMLALRQLQDRMELLAVISALYNRLRLAALVSSFGDQCLDALNAKFYQGKMAREATKHYGKDVLWRSVAALGLSSAAEKMGLGKGWLGLEMVLLEMIRTQPPFSDQLLP